MSGYFLDKDKEQNGIGIYIQTERNDETNIAIVLLDENKKVTSYVLLDKKSSEYLANYLLETWSLLEKQKSKDLH